MSGMGPNLMINAGDSRYYSQAASALGLSSANFTGNPNYDKINSYAQAFGASLNDPLYQQVAKNIGITSYDSINDYKQVLASMAGGGGGAAAPAPAPAAPPNPAAYLPSPNNGSYGNIIDNVNYQGDLGQSTAAMYNNMAPTTASGAPGQAGASSAAGQSTTSAADAQVTALNQMMIQQQAAFQQQAAMQQQQIAAANAALAEQRRQADALSRAYVPAPEKTAAAPSINSYEGAGRNPNTLSSLSIMGGRSSYASSLAGLQIA